MLDFFRKYNNEITWAIIGWMAFACVDSLARGNYVWAVIDAGLAYGNYYMWKINR